MMNRNISLLGLIIFLIFISISCKKEKFEIIETDFDYKFTMTSGLDENFLPIDELNEVDLSIYAGDTVYFFVEWLDLSKSNYLYEGTIYDPNNNVAYLGDPLYVNGNTGKANTYTYVDFKETGNPVGLWKFEAMMDNQLGASVKFEVK